ncbi:hypothetical protein [Actinocatenispora rupis]|uniref:Uncharacterized protein n=1 Tax=Actinocatenispora rupis TaxID=519421 RepID=A0A8J3J5L1_9ACTN|nr:hypothetical protein [Actinocatenispora rupis]GID16316.1 hypothetical protein Aru02nite_72050 [Actinocatenispora rupis]
MPYRGDPDWRQYLLRALVFRLVAHCGPDGADDGEAGRYGAVADALLRG